MGGGGGGAPCQEGGGGGRGGGGAAGGEVARRESHGTSRAEVAGEEEAGQEAAEAVWSKSRRLGTLREEAAVEMLRDGRYDRDANWLLRPAPDGDGVDRWHGDGACATKKRESQACSRPGAASIDGTAREDGCRPWPLETALERGGSSVRSEGGVVALSLWDLLASVTSSPLGPPWNSSMCAAQMELTVRRVAALASCRR